MNKDNKRIEKRTNKKQKTKTNKQTTNKQTKSKVTKTYEFPDRLSTLRPPTRTRSGGMLENWHFWRLSAVSLFKTKMPGESLERKPLSVIASAFSRSTQSLEMRQNANQKKKNPFADQVEKHDKKIPKTIEYNNSKRIMNTPIIILIEVIIQVGRVQAYAREHRLIGLMELQHLKLECVPG
jgi:hypothetical protein